MISKEMAARFKTLLMTLFNGWFYGVSTLVGLFYVEVSLTIMISHYKRYKNVYIQPF